MVTNIPDNDVYWYIHCYMQYTTMYIDLNVHTHIYTFISIPSDIQQFFSLKSTTAQAFVQEWIQLNQHFTVQSLELKKKKKKMFDGQQTQ